MIIMLTIMLTRPDMMTYQIQGKCQCSAEELDGTLSSEALCDTPGY